MKHAIIRLRRGTALEWQNSSPQPNGEVLKLGEPGYEKDTGKLKIGNGIDGWNNLSYVNGGSSVDIETLQDMIGDNFLVAGSGITLNYDDINNNLIINNSKQTFDAAVEWTPNHSYIPGDEKSRYLAGDLVYNSGNLYRAKFDNESLPVNNTTYWENLGPGYRLNIDGRDIPNLPTINIGQQVQNLMIAGDGISLSYGDDPNYDITISVSGDYATLEDGKIPSVQLPSYVDDVLEFAGSGNFPNPGSSSIIYIALDTNKTYRWGNTSYFEIVSSPGTTDSIVEGVNNLYFTIERASDAAPVQSVNTKVGAVNLTKNDIGLNNSDNLPEGTGNLYFTSQRVLDFAPVKNIVAGNGISVSSSNEEFTISSLGLSTNSIMDGRLSLSSQLAAPLSDMINANTLYYHPHNGNIVSLYDNIQSVWKLYTLTSPLSLNLSSFTADTNYDIFLYDNNGTLLLEGIAWTDSGAGTNARNINISRQNGILVRADSINKRYVGSLRTSGSGICEDSNNKRFLYNQYNRIPRRLFVNNTTAHTYSSSTIRPWNNNTNYGQTRIGFIVGFSIESNMDVHLNSDFHSGIVRVGLNSVSSGACECLIMSNNSATNLRSGSSSSIYGQTGFNYLQILESSSSTGTFNSAIMVCNILL